MKKIIIAVIVVVLAVLLFACLGGSSPDPIDTSAAKIVTDDSGAHYATLTASYDSIVDLSCIQDVYTDYFKPNRDAGDLDYLIIKADGEDKATFFTGKTVYAGCPLDADGFPKIKDAEKTFMAGSNDALLSEV